MANSSNSINGILENLRQFRDECNWGKFHNPKDLALAISIEAVELNEKFLWKTAEEAKAERVQEELADVLLFAFQLADHYKWGVLEIMQEKLAKNAEKYLIDKAKGVATK